MKPGPSEELLDASWWRRLRAWVRPVGGARRGGADQHRSSARHDLGDAVCCAALIAVALGGLVALFWAVWHIPPLR